MRSSFRRRLLTALATSAAGVLTASALTAAVGATASETSPVTDAAAVTLQPHGLDDAVCADTPLRFTFPDPVELGTSGSLQVHSADGDVVDEIDLEDPSWDQRTIGGARSAFGELHQWTYFPVVIDGNTASVHLHERLPGGGVFYVTVDPGFFAGHDGVSDPEAWRFRTQADPRPGTERVSVDDSGNGADFCTVQGAIDFVPEGNSEPVHIDVAAGTYKEITYVPQNKAHIRIHGSGTESTVIGYANNNLLNGDYAMEDVPETQSHCPRRVLPHADRHNCWRAAMGVDADDFQMDHVTIQNFTPDGESQAEAFRGNGDKIVLSNVKLLGYQDTLRLQGRAFVTDSYIEGDVDFVWGTGGVFVQNSELKSLDEGYINNVRTIGDSPGNIFVNVRLTRGPDTPDDSVYLARAELARFAASQAVFIDSAMDDHIKPVGWQVYRPGDCDFADYVRLWEYASTDLDGDPLDTSQRLECSRQLTADEADKLRDPAYSLDGWDPR